MTTTKSEHNSAPATEVTPIACTLEISGMDCASCGEKVERALHSLPGVEHAEADVMGGKVRLRLDERAQSEAIDRALRDTGYPVRRVAHLQGDFVWTPTVVALEDTTDIPWFQQHRVLIYTALAAFFCLVAIGIQFGADMPRAVLLFSLLGMAFGGRYVIPAGLKSLRYGALDINFLMSAAAVGAIVIGEYVEGASVLVLFAIAEYLEERSMARARNAVKGLMALTPQEASLVRNGQEQRVAVETLNVGDIVRVRPGERIPVDGTVQSGASSVNQAAITGESVPVLKEKNDEVFAGTMNGDGAMDLRVDKLAQDTTLAKILHTMEEAQASRSQTQRFVDRFARYYTPAVVLATILIALVPPLLFGGEWNTWIYRGLVLLVVSCPCALVIATPVTMVSALGGAAKAGVLIKGGRYLEAAADLKTVVWDKTGTLTQGSFSVDAVLPFQDTDPREIIELAALAEVQSEHHYAAAIVAHARTQEIAIDIARVQNMQAHVGRGVEARVDNSTILVGNERFLTERNVWDPACKTLLEDSDDATTTTIVAQIHDDGSARILGAIRLKDTLRPDAAEAIQALRARGVANMIMLTGDGENAARSIAAQLSAQNAPLNDVRFSLLPHDKVEAAKEIREKMRGTIAMIGDGINDAPALAQADIGVAMGHVATDIALEAADVVLAGPNLRALDTLMHYAHRAQRILRVNIAIALGLKFLFIVLAVSGYATLWMAILADTGATVIVVANGLRAMRGPAEAEDADTPHVAHAPALT